MSWKKELFGKAPSGGDVYKYTLTNANGASAAFTDLGGTWLGMVVPDRNGGMADVLLGWGSPEAITTRGGHMGEIVGRNANRIGGASFTLGGKTYFLKKNAGENNIHSGDDFYRDRVWKAEVTEDPANADKASGMVSGLAPAGGAAISFFLESPAGDQGFPGNAEICVTYTLTADNALRLDYRMECDEDTIANFTNHAYFNLAGHAAGSILGQKVWIDASSWTPADGSSVPTGEIAPVAGTPMDFTIPKAIGRDIDAPFPALISAGGYDHNYVLNHAPGRLALSAKVWDESSGRCMEVYTDLPGIQFYTGNGIKEFLSKDGKTVYGPRYGYCFETQNFPDAVNKPSFPSPVLRKGGIYKTTTVYKFTVED